METALARIPAASRHQALDWSLVLLSQGIEPTVENTGGDGAWEVLVPAQDHDKALAAIRQYQIENRRWPWRREVLESGLLFDWAALAWTILLCIFYSLVAARPGLEAVGVMDNLAVAHGEWWRLFTSTWLHADLGHLAGNATIGFVLLGLAMARHGTGIGLLASYLAGVGGNLIAWFVSGPSHRSLGASGVVMGALGLLTIYGLWSRRKSGHSVKNTLMSFVAGAFLFILVGLSPGSDVVTHLGGFLCGALIGASLTKLPNAARMPKANLAAGFAFALMTVWPWWLAAGRL